MPDTNRQAIALIITIFVLPFLLFWRWLFRGEVLFWGTSLFQFWPWHSLSKTIALSGEWPLWNPLLGNGTPLLANLQTAFFYPPNLLYFLMPVEHGLTLSVILHLSLAGLLMYGYGRTINLSPFGAAIAALSYMFSGYITGRAQFVTMVNALAWFPLLLLLSERLASKFAVGRASLCPPATAWGCRCYLKLGPLSLWLALVLAIQLLAGHAQLWFYGLWLIGPYTLFRVWQQTAQQPTGPRVKSLLGATLAVGFAVGVAILLAAVQILPTAEFTTQSPRGSGAARYFALSYSFWPWRLITLIAPNFFGHPANGDYWGYATYWEDHAYIGTLPFILALSAVWGYYQPLKKFRAESPLPIDHPVVPFFAWLVPVSLLLALGWNTPVYLWLFDYIPGFGYFQAPSRLLIWYTLAMAVLAGIGADYFTITARRGWLRFMIACLGIASAGLAGSVLLSGVRLTFLTATTGLGFMLALSIIILLMRPATTLPQRADLPHHLTRLRRWQGLLLLFVILDLAWTATPLWPMLSPALYREAIASATVLKQQPGSYRFFVADDFDHHLKFDQYYRFAAFGPTRIDHWQQLKETLVPNIGVYAGLPSANNDDPLVVGRHQRLLDLVQKSEAPQKERLLALMNVGYVIDEPAADSASPLYQTEALAIRPVSTPRPRAYFVPTATVAETESAAIARLTAPDFDSSREVVIINRAGSNGVADRPRVHQPDSPSDGPLPVVTVEDGGPQQLTLTLEAPTSGFVVLTDTFYPGWHATINGQPVPIREANLAFRAVAVEAGTHEIDFRYHPLSFVIGLWLSGGTLVLIIILKITLKRTTA